MNKLVLIAALPFALATGGGAPAHAQVAAEEAVILSGSSGQAAAQNSLGDAISGSVNSAAQALRAANAANSASASTGPRGTPSGYAGSIPEGDPLENTDAKAFEVQGGARLRLSGSFRPSRTTSCAQNCEAAPVEPAEAEKEAVSPE